MNKRITIATAVIVLAVMVTFIAASSFQPDTQPAEVAEDTRTQDPPAIVIDEHPAQPAKVTEDTRTQLPPDFVAVDAALLGSSEIPEEFAASSNAFAVDFYRHGNISGAAGQNVFFSPPSMYVAFSMLYEGAREDTASQMQQTFGYESDATARHNTTAHAMSALSRDDGHYELNMANAVWLAHWFKPLEQYSEIVRDTYLADVDRVDFVDEDDGIARINDWASDNTNARITEIIGPGDVGNLTAMVLTNAIYFKGSWVTPFPENATAESDFWHGDGTGDATKTDFMNVAGEFDYSSQDGVQVLRMPYQGDRLSMMLVLPEDRDGIRVLEESLSPDMIGKWREGLVGHSEVLVSMPKFAMKTSYDLKPVLEDLGMPDAFHQYNANFSGIMPILEKNLYVSNASHYAFVDVNEEGTEAAAATVITVEELSEPPRFIADYPFIFLIQDDQSGAILFMGRFSSPAT